MNPEEITPKPIPISWEETKGWDAKMDIILDSDDYPFPTKFPFSSIKRLKENIEKNPNQNVRLSRIGDEIHARVVYSKSSNE